MPDRANEIRVGYLGTHGRPADERLLLGLDNRFRIVSAGSAKDAAGAAREGRIDVALVGARSLDGAVRQSAATLRDAAPALPLVVICDESTGDAAMESLQYGVQEVLPREGLDAFRLARALQLAVERERIHQERVKGFERIRELEAYKTQFINTAAHELNAPLTPIKLQLHMLHDQPEARQEPWQHALRIIDRNVDRLINLVRDVLEAARLQARRLTIRRERWDLDRTVREAVENLRPAAEAAALRVAVESQPGLTVDADPDRMAQVVHNLVQNAIKFTPTGGQVAVQASRGGDQVIVSVRDTGIGLRSTDFEKLFQPFSQTHEWSGRRTTGSGLGLYITQGIVEQHGGRMWCDSAGPNRGSTFSFALPYADASTPAPAPGPRHPRPEPTGFWPIFYFKCPTCASRDINMRILRNRYECRACTYWWK